MTKRLLIPLALLSAMTSPPALADNWGCEVLLCLSNPAGPMAVGACVPPIERLYKAIFKRKPDPFPTCTLSSGADSASGGNYAYVGEESYYNGCPGGMTVAPPSSIYVAAGRVATQADRAAPGATGSNYVFTSGIYRGVGDGAGYYPSSEYAMPTKVCIGNRVGQTTYDAGVLVSVTLYDKIAVIAPATDTFNINVVIQGDLYTTVRPSAGSSGTTVFTGN